MPESELNYAIMCSGTKFDDWKAECIQKLFGVRNVNLKLLIQEENDGPTAGLKGKINKFLDYRDKTSTRLAINKFFWYLFRKLSSTPPCKSKTDLSGRLDSVDTLKCSVREEGFSQYFYENDLKQIKEYELDFILRFSFGIIRGEILNIPKYGVWSFHHDDEQKYRGGPACFWEIYENDPITGAVLQRLTDRLDSGVILKKGYFPTVEFYNKNLNNVYFGTTEWPAQVAKDILLGNRDYLDNAPQKSEAPIYRAPSLFQIIFYILTRILHLIKKICQGIANWNIGVVKDTTIDFLDGQIDSEVEWNQDVRKDGFIADPFPVTIEDKTHIFFENYSYTKQKAVISYTEHPDGFRKGEFKTAYEPPQHISYPFIFKHNQKIYSTPELYETNEIRLYRIKSPSNWELVSVLVSDVKGVDPTVIYFENKWWLFYTKRTYSSSKLFLHYADDLTGDWRPHKNNPAKIDIRSSRPGGTPFVRDNELYRPAQNCAGEYGKSIVINKVNTLTPAEFEEEKINEFSPPAESNKIGIHTLSFDENTLLIDGKRRVRNKFFLLHKVRQISPFND